MTVDQQPAPAPHPRRGLSRLDRALESRQGTLVVIRGAAGTGKSTALDRIVESLATGVAAGGTVLRFQCRPAGPSLALGRDLVHALGGTARRIDPDLLRPGTDAVLLALRFFARSDSGADPDPVVLHGLARLAANVAALGPLVLAVDDLHHCDEHSLRWLDYLLRRTRDLPLAVVAAVRTPVPESLSGLLGEHTGGGSVLAPGPASDEPRRPGRTEPAAGVVDGLAGRPEHVRHVARAVAVLSSTDPDLVAALTRIPVRAVVADLAVLREANILVAPDNPRHALVRDALLRDMPDDELTWQRRGAARLLSDAGRPAEEVVRLLGPPAGGPPEPWLRTVLVDAAREAAARGAPKVALRHLRPLLDADPDDVALRRQYGELLAKINPLTAFDHLRATMELVDDVRTRAALAVQLGTCALAAYGTHEVLDLLRDTLSALRAEVGAEACADDDELRAQLEGIVAQASSGMRTTFGGVRGWFTRTPPAEGGTPAERNLLAVRAMIAMTGEGSAAEAIELARRALPLDHPSYEWPTVACSTVVLMNADLLPEALAALDVVVANSQADGATWPQAPALGLRAHVHAFAGNLAESVADAQHSFELAKAEGWPGELVRSTATALATALVPLGQAARVRAVLESVTDERLANSPWESASHMFALAEVRAADGDTDGALDLLLRIGRGLAEDGIANPLVVPWWSTAALLLAEQQREREAMPLAEHGEELSAGWDVPRARGMALRARAMASDGLRRVDLLAESAAVLESSCAVLDRQHTLFLLGRELLRRKDVLAAREHLRVAAELGALCGARAAAVRARDLLLLAGGRMRKVTGARTDVLTAAELRVVELVVAGATNREIAEQLFVTRRTVEVHLTKAYRKLGVTGRGELSNALRAWGFPRGCG